LNAGTRIPLYFIHGMWSFPGVWDGLRARFELAGWTTHAACLPWHDRASNLPPAPELAGAGLQDYVDFLVADIGRLPEVPIIVGHSLGGFLAQAVAERVQPPGLVLLSTGPTASTAAPALTPLRTVWGVIRHWGWWKKPTLLDPEGARYGIYNNVPADIVEAEIKALVWDSGRALFELSLPGLAKAEVAKINYNRLAMPALVIVGDEDRVTPAAQSRNTARALTGAVDYHAVSGAGHWLFHAPVVGKVGDLIERWLGQFQDAVR
jgi:pimeloyl-ACP methyl ester carboxylesterase